ncbi:hypothetical protein [Arthrobacter sp. 92]|jgi:hypothetical protein|uniref:hypothetical protein n=1 Tax=Arthrobacter sp. 92 TaxID=3418175 RepID=UPI003D03D8AC
MSSATIESRTPAVRSFHLTFSSAEEVHRGLENAVKALIEAAVEDGTCGIRVTRHEAGTYTVTLDETVPFGETYEDVTA